MKNVLSVSGAVALLCVLCLPWSAAGGPAQAAADRAKVIKAAMKATRWKETWAGMYDDRNRGSDYTLIRVKPTRLEIVSMADGLVNDPKTWRPVAIDLR